MAELFQWGKFDSSKVPPQLNYISKFPVGTKIKTSDGTKWEILEFDHEGYPDNTVTLWSEFALYETTFMNTDANAVDYTTSILRNDCTNLYNTLSSYEKSCIPLTTLEVFKGVDNTHSEAIIFDDYVFILSGTELGFELFSEGDGTQFSEFNSSSKRIKYNTSNIACVYYTRSKMYDVAHPQTFAYIQADGNVARGNINPSMSVTPDSIYFVPAFNLSKQTILSDEPDSEGYYSIVGLSDNGVVASSLNIGEKVILGKYNNENIPWEIVAKNHYNNNDINLWTLYSLDATQFNETRDTAESIDYRNSIPKTLCQSIYNSFTEKEKGAVLLTTLPTCVTNTGSVVTLQDYVFLFSGKELGGTGNHGGDTGCTSFNFTTEQKNARAKLSNGNWTNSSWGAFWSRSAYVHSSSSIAVYWYSNSSSLSSTYPSFSYGFAPATNISSNTILYKHSDGNYYLDKENEGGGQ